MTSDSDSTQPIPSYDPKVAEIDGGWGLASVEWNDLDLDWGPGMYTPFDNVTDANPQLKVIYGYEYQSNSLIFSEKFFLQISK